MGGGRDSSLYVRALMLLDCVTERKREGGGMAFSMFGPMMLLDYVLLCV